MECHKGNPHFKPYIPSSKACSNKTRLWSRPEKSIAADALCAKDTKRRETLALLDLFCLRVSASVEMCPPPNATAGTSVGSENEQRCNWPKSPLIQHVRTMHTWFVIHGSLYCGANTVLTWHAPKLELRPGTARSTGITEIWTTSRLTRWSKHWNKTTPWCLLHEAARADY